MNCLLHNSPSKPLQGSKRATKMQICTLGGGFLSEANRWTTSRDDAEYSQWLDKSQEKIFGVKSLELQKTGWWAGRKDHFT